MSSASGSGFRKQLSSNHRLQNFPEIQKKCAKNGAPDGPGDIWYLGLHRAFYSKMVAGNYSILGGLWVAFGALCCPKASATLSHFTFLRTIFDQKPEKRHPKRHSEIDTEKASKNNAKRLPKRCQNGCQIDHIFDLL